MYKKLAGIKGFTLKNPLSFKTPVLLEKIIPTVSLGSRCVKFHGRFAPETRISIIFALVGGTRILINIRT